MNNFKVIYRILRTLEQALDADSVNVNDLLADRFSISQQRWFHLVKMLADNDYIKGINISRAADGKNVVQLSHPQITLKGLEYLESNKMMKKVNRMLRKGKRIIPEETTI